MTATEKAREAAMFVQGVQFWLLAASGPDLDRQQARQALERAFQAWEPFKRLMGELEALAPNAHAVGKNNAACLAEIAGRAG